MGEAKININSNGELTHIEIDGVPVNARAVTFRAEVGKHPVINIEYMFPNLTLETKLAPNLPEVLKPYYTSNSDICEMLHLSKGEFEFHKRCYEKEKDCQHK